MASFVVEDVTVIDGTGSPPLSHADVVVRDGHITVVEPCGSHEHGNLMTLDGRGRHLIPGMWETQAHLTRYANGVMDDAAVRWPEEGDFEILDANLRSYLRNGFTSVVDLGGPTEVLRGLRDRFEAAPASGARLLYVGRQFIASGGLPRFGDLPVDSLLTEVDDPVEAEGALDHAVELGIDAVKINHTPGFMLFGTGWPMLDRATLTALIDGAHARNLPVMVHIDDAASAIEVLELGVDGIEHTFEAPPERLEADVRAVTDLCLARGAYWAMTVAYLEGMARAGDRALLTLMEVGRHVLPRVLDQVTDDPRSLWVNMPDDLRSYFERRFEEAMETVAMVHAEGVPMTISTDSGNPCTFHGLTAIRELELMEKAGIDPLQIIRAATFSAAEKFRRGDELGTIEPGKRADLVLLSADPLASIGNVRQIELIFQDGIARRPLDVPV